MFFNSCAGREDAKEVAAHTHTHLRPYTTPIGTQEEGDDLLRRLSMTQRKNRGEAGRLWFVV